MDPPEKGPDIEQGPRNLANMADIPLEIEPNPANQDPEPPKSESEDPWTNLPAIKNHGEKWSEMTSNEKFLGVLKVFFKIIVTFCLLYLFICSLDLMQSAFRLLGGKAAGKTFANDVVFDNPMAGVMVGILCTVLVQSSSTTTSIVVSMVASNIITVRKAIPIVMGANVGTSITNTIVSLTQSHSREEFRHAFAAATVHDMFNWLSVLVLLPLEAISGYLYEVTNWIVSSYEWKTNDGVDKEFLNVITRPFAEFIIQLDKNVTLGITMGDPAFQNQSMIQLWCKGNRSATDMTQIVNPATNEHQCSSIFNRLQLSDSLTGGILLVFSLALMATCLIFMVYLLNSMLLGRIAVIIKSTLNSDFPGPLAFLTGYLALITGCGLTILVQSSSVFTSTLTPLVGIGVISLERMYPLTLGSNIGTTTTGILASLTVSGPQLRSSIQIALCHLFFNLTGILIFYPIPFTRLPIMLAKKLGDTAGMYRWFAIMYIIMAFFVLPAAIFMLCLAGLIVFLCVMVPITVTVIVVVIINIIQQKRPSLLPGKLKTWNWLPLWVRSLKPMDRIVQTIYRCCKCRRNDDALDKENGDVPE